MNPCQVEKLGSFRKFAFPELADGLIQAVGMLIQDERNDTQALIFTPLGRRQQGKRPRRLYRRAAPRPSLLPTYHFMLH